MRDGRNLLPRPCPQRPGALAAHLGTPATGRPGAEKSLMPNHSLRLVGGPAARSTIFASVVILIIDRISGLHTRTVHRTGAGTDDDAKVQPSHKPLATYEGDCKGGFS